jgi:hypothetical protein
LEVVFVMVNWFLISRRCDGIRTSELGPRVPDIQRSFAASLGVSQAGTVVFLVAIFLSVRMILAIFLTQL